MPVERRRIVEASTGMHTLMIQQLDTLIQQQPALHSVGAASSRASAAVRVRISISPCIVIESICGLVSTNENLEWLMLLITLLSLTQKFKRAPIFRTRKSMKTWSASFMLGFILPNKVLFVFMGGAGLEGVCPSCVLCCMPCLLYDHASTPSRIINHAMNTTEPQFSESL